MPQNIQPCYQAFHHKADNFNRAFDLYDPTVIASFLEPKLFTILDAPVYVDTSGLCSGKTILDLHHCWTGQRESKVAVEADARSVIDLLTDRFIR